MPEPAKIAKAYLVQLDNAQTPQEKPDTKLEVQFNPETLKVSYSNQIVQPNNPSGQTGPGQNASNPPVKAGTQYVGKGSTKLAVQLLFDVTGHLSETSQSVAKGDVRNLTKKVVELITPKAGDTQDPSAMVPPKVRFSWGSFRFEGIVESLEESLEFFSPEGRPLRASLLLSLVQQEIKFFDLQGAGSPSPGTRPQTQAPAGISLQGLADAAGLGGNWQQIASANGIENPRQLEPGQLVDLSLRR